MPPRSCRLFSLISSTAERFAGDFAGASSVAGEMPVSIDMLLSWRSVPDASPAEARARLHLKLFIVEPYSYPTQATLRNHGRKIQTSLPVLSLLPLLPGTS